MKYIETERLILRGWRDDDVASFARINADPIVMEYFPRRLDEKDTLHLVERFREHFNKHGYGPYAVEHKQTGQFIGFVGLTEVGRDMPFYPAVEIAWRLDYEYWGKGYATEASQAVIKHAFKEANLKEIVAYAVHDNDRAIHIMEKLGMKRDPAGDFDYPRLSKTHPLGKFVLYRIQKKASKKAA